MVGALQRNNVVHSEWYRRGMRAAAREGRRAMNERASEIQEGATKRTERGEGPESERE